MRTAVVSSSSARVTVDLAERRAERVRGLIGRRSDRGLLLPLTRSVHTFGMRRSIHAVLLDVDHVVVAVVRLAPKRVLLPRRRVRHVLELFRSPFSPGESVTVELDQAGQSHAGLRPPEPSRYTASAAPAGAWRCARRARAPIV